jgi:hypothetical protein
MNNGCLPGNPQCDIRLQIGFSYISLSLLGKGRQRHFGVLDPRGFAGGDAGLRGAKDRVLDEGMRVRRTHGHRLLLSVGVDVKLLRMKLYKGPEADSTYTRSGEETSRYL